MFGTKGPIQAKTPAYFIDLTIKKGTEYEHVIPKGWNCMVICHQGQMTVQDIKKVEKGGAVVFEQSVNDELLKFSSMHDETRFILLAGQPMNEPIAAQGPFVLNEREELYKAFEDYQRGKNGFEGADTWQSDIQNLRFKSKTY